MLPAFGGGVSNSCIAIGVAFSAFTSLVLNIASLRLHTGIFSLLKARPPDATDGVQGAGGLPWTNQESSAIGVRDKSAMQGEHGDNGKPGSMSTGCWTMLTAAAAAAAATAVLISACNATAPLISAAIHCAVGHTGGAGGGAATEGHATASKEGSATSSPTESQLELADCLDSAGRTSGRTSGLAASSSGLPESLGVFGTSKSPMCPTASASDGGCGGGGGTPSKGCEGKEQPPSTAAGEPH